jgi:Flp pilus assembly protein CpaB
VVQKSQNAWKRGTPRRILALVFTVVGGIVWIVDNIGRASTVRDIAQNPAPWIRASGMVLLHPLLPLGLLLVRLTLLWDSWRITRKKGAIDDEALVDDAAIPSAPPASSAVDHTGQTFSDSAVVVVAPGLLSRGGRSKMNCGLQGLAILRA